MKHTIMISLILMMLVFTGAAHAQHVKAFNGHDGVLLSSSTMPTITAFAGKTIRLRIAAANNRSRDMNDMYIFQSEVRLAHGQVPCEGRERTGTGPPGLSAGKVSWGYDPAAKEYNSLLETHRAWKGTCRIVVLRSTDGTEHRARIRFK